mgnify:CR=1 FL=1
MGKSFQKVPLSDLERIFILREALSPLQSQDVMKQLFPPFAL